ncbi:reverse transcriptase domain-containing protein [Tanacetum coccineum]
MSVRLADRSFQYPVGIAENILVEVGKFTFPAYFVILEMEEDSKVPLILGRPFLHTADAVIRVKQKQLNLGVRTEHFDALLDEENSKSEFDTKEPQFEQITFNTDYKIKTSLEEPPTDLELKPLPDNFEYAFLEEPSFLPVIISSSFERKQKKNRCMLAIFHDMIEESVEVFMDDFSVFGNSFDHRLNNLDKMLQRCKEANLALNWEKCHFMVIEGIVLGHKMSGTGREVDKAKINTKLRSRWLGPYVVKHQYPSGYVELYGKDGKTFIVNGHRLKLYHEEDNDPREELAPFFPKE